MLTNYLTKQLNHYAYMSTNKPISRHVQVT